MKQAATVMAGLVPAIGRGTLPLRMAGTGVQPGDIADGCSETWLTVSFRV
jgi:hypothetical protein